VSVFDPDMNRLLDQVVDLLDIPPSYYQKATDRYRSLGEWLSRENSQVADADPHVYAQGSFRYGTVIRPLLKTEKYDLDLVCEVALSKSNISQKQAKHLVGDEIKAYAEAHSFQEPAEEKTRCWRLNYADGVSFHMDILPALPEDDACKTLLLEQGVPLHLAKKSVAITDKDHPNYLLIASGWPCSNPGGFADWFEGRMRVVAEARVKQLVLNAAYASIDKVPSWEWKTPLQRAIQLLKRHRDVMFRKDLSLGPISMIITTLAAHAYGGETNIFHALSNIVERMPAFVLPSKPRIPNPVHPDEDFADRWASDKCLETNFWNWHTQVKADLGNLAVMLGTGQLPNTVEKRFAVALPEDLTKDLAVTGVAASLPAHRPTPVVKITTPPRPWRD
jgi:hypothetical protein